MSSCVALGPEHKADAASSTKAGVLGITLIILQLQPERFASMKDDCIPAAMDIRRCDSFILLLADWRTFAIICGLTARMTVWQEDQIVLSALLS
jgi:hypothetical protein